MSIIDDFILWCSDHIIVSYIIIFLLSLAPLYLAEDIFTKEHQENKNKKNNN